MVLKMVIFNFLPKSSYIYSEEEILTTSNDNNLSFDYISKEIEKPEKWYPYGLNITLIRPLVEGTSFSATVYKIEDAKTYFLFLYGKEIGFQSLQVFYLDEEDPHNDEFAILGNYLFLLPGRDNSKIYYIHIDGNYSIKTWTIVNGFYNTINGKEGTIINNSFPFCIADTHIGFGGGDNFHGIRYYLWNESSHTLSFSNYAHREIKDPYGSIGKYIRISSNKWLIVQGNTSDGKGVNLWTNYTSERGYVIGDTSTFTFYDDSLSSNQGISSKKVNASIYNGKIGCVITEEEGQGYIYSTKDNGYTYSKTKLLSSMRDTYMLQITEDILLLVNRDYLYIYTISTRQLNTIVSATFPSSLFVVPGIPFIVYDPDITNKDQKLMIYGRVLKNIPLLIPEGSYINGVQMGENYIPFPKNNQSLELIISPTPLKKGIYMYYEDHYFRW